MTKDDILTMLIKMEGETRSGAEMAESLGISRAAVWKAIQTLRQEGHEIAAVAHRGYALSQRSDVLTKAGVVAALPPAMAELAIHVYQELPSTNQTAKKMAIDGAAHGTVVLANRQTAGRGRYGRSFYSPAGSGLYMSVVLRERAYLATATKVTAAVAVLVCEAIQQLTGISAEIKWVNDLLCPHSGRKLCGILTEAVTSMESATVDFLVVGIGINVHTEDFPEEISTVATALLTASSAVNGGGGTGHRCSPVTRTQLAGAVIGRMLTNADWITAPSTYEGYQQRLSLLGKTVTVHLPQEAYEAVAVGVDPDYQLVVRRPDGTLQTLSSGEVSVRVR